MLNKRSCFPEIAGDAAIYFKMTQKESDIKEKLEMVYSMGAEERNSLLCKQKNRLALYSWEKSAKKMAEVYSALV